MKKEGVELWALSIEEVFSKLGTSKSGLSTAEADKRILKLGPERFLKKNTRHWLEILITQFKDPLAGVLIFAAIISMFLGEVISAVVIISIILVNALIGFYQELKAEKTMEELEKYVKLKSKVYRDGRLTDVDAEDLVPGDIIKLEIGDIIPADIRLFDVDEMTTDEAALTGESVPVTKKISVITERHSLPQYLYNMAFSGTSVASGTGLGVVTAVGKKTFFGKTAALIGMREVETDFHKGMRQFGNMSMRIVLFMTVFIFVANTILGKPPFDSFLFALALAVGITPEMLPIIITITLSHGALRMAREKVIVKNLESVEDLGNIDVLCCDKTGTLTEGALSLREFYNLDGQSDEKLIIYASLCNAARESENVNPTINPIDKAIWEYQKPAITQQHVSSYKVIDENSFDFQRKRMSVLVQSGGKRYIIAKGAPEQMLEISKYALVKGKKVKLDKKLRESIVRKIEENESKGYRIIAVTERGSNKKEIDMKDEKDMTFLGFLLFLDPPKESTKEVLSVMQNLGIKIKIMTGDSPIITRKICNDVGLAIVESRIITGEDLDKMDANELKISCDKYNIFARVTPEQKYLIVTKLQEAGHEVGFLGDGINDAPALKAATIGITVDTAAGIAKESADIILLRKGLNVIVDGIHQGRKTFGNITKYMMNTISANYGNMITVALSSLFLKFIPLLPSQILLNNLLSDIPLFAVPIDNVDKEQLKKPKKWNLKVIESFMMFFGMISTAFDLLLILLLLFVFQADPSVFRTAWFIESSLSEIIVTFSIRTKHPFYKSKPGKALMWASLVTSLAVIGVTYTALGGSLFEFVALPWQIIVVIVSVLALYFATAEMGKHFFFKKHEI